MISDKTIIFAGSSSFSLEPLKSIVELGFQSVKVLTQPSKKKGRGLKNLPNPVMTLAKKLDLETFSFESFDRTMVKEKLNASSSDILLTASYGKLIPDWFLDFFTLDTLNIHPSLLPSWRGASPIQSAILNGDKITGISIMRMTPNLDAGPVFLSEIVEIKKNDTSSSLTSKLSRIAANTIKKSLEQILSGEIQALEQDHNEATFSKKISKDEGRIDWSQTAESIDRMVRAYNPWPVAFTYLEEKYLRIWDSSLSSDHKDYKKPGEVIEQTDSGILVSTGKGNLLIKEIQLAGKKTMSANHFSKGMDLKNKSFN